MTQSISALDTGLASHQPLLVQLLLERGAMRDSDLPALHQALLKHPGTLEETLVGERLADEADIASAYADYLRLEQVACEEPLTVQGELMALVGEKLCRERLLVPLRQDEGALTVALANPSDLNTLEELQLLTGLVIRPVVATVGLLQEAVGKTFGQRDMVKEIATEATAAREVEPSGQLEDAVEEVIDLDRPVSKSQDSHVIRLVNHILLTAVRDGASDIHLEPMENGVKVRARVDGRLEEISPPPKSMYVPMVNRLKILAKMDIAERRVPQDGAIALTVDQRRVDLRVNTVPTVHGEKMVLRLLFKGSVPLDLTELGFSRRQADDLVTAAESPHGLLLVTGPTGSGKSTTLYAVLNLLNKPDLNVLTVEDPVEYKIEGLNQVQVRNQVGLTFASALRAFLRQDPDVIMVGEVRDQETAQICLRAALTGHMVLSTLHTNDALAAVNRLVDMGVERFLLASALRLVQAQRLVRRLCPHCRQAYKLETDISERLDLELDRDYFRPQGCPKCRHTGYRGRVGLFEVVPIKPRLREMIAGGASLGELRQEARRQEMTMLRQAGLEQVRLGVTSLGEALSVCLDEEDL